MLGGHVIAGAWASTTVMLKLHVTVFPEVSVPVQITPVVPSEKLEPLPGLQETVGDGQLSVMVGTPKATVALQVPAAVFTVMSDGQSSSVGGSVSTTVMLKLHVWELP